MEGVGGASAGDVNRGLTIYGSNTYIATYSGNVSVTGTGGPNTRFFGPARPRQDERREIPYRPPDLLFQFAANVAHR